jgi:integrase
MALTDTKIKNAKGMDKQYKLSDGNGLYLLVTPAGGKLWRFDYRFEGKRKTLAMGKYPEIPLSEARIRLLEAKTELAHDVDPGIKKKAEKQDNSFKTVAMEWYRRILPSWSDGHARTIISRLERDVFPWMSNQKINEINAPDVLQVLRRVEARGAIESAHRIKTIFGQIFRYAIATGRADRDPAADLKGALSAVKAKNMAALTEPSEFAELLRAIDNYKGTFIVRCALKIQAYTFVRPGELRHAEWCEIDLNAKEWRISAEKMKIRQPHIVPLARQVIEILKELHPLTGHGKYVFPGRSLTRPLSENGVLTALRTMGFSKEQMSGHGFRAAARTMLDEVLKQRVDLIEHQLAHAVRDPLGRAYNRTKHLDERRKMMQLWADYIDGLKAGAQVLPLKRKLAE